MCKGYFQIIIPVGIMLSGLEGALMSNTIKIISTCLLLMKACIFKLYFVNLEHTLKKYFKIKVSREKIVGLLQTSPSQSPISPNIGDYHRQQVKVVNYSRVGCVSAAITVLLQVLG